jgi:hypothetical protein
MASRETKPAKLDPIAHDRLAELQKQLGSQGLSRNVDRIEILSALVLYISVPRVAGMLREYWRYTDELVRASEDQSKK